MDDEVLVLLVIRRRDPAISSASFAGSNPRYSSGRRLE
jgi:hypothetical protein